LLDLKFFLFGGTGDGLSEFEEFLGELETFVLAGLMEFGGGVFLEGTVGFCLLFKFIGTGVMFVFDFH
jgi:hypothetical protein